jgi:hypothetical protein
MCTDISKQPHMYTIHHVTRCLLGDVYRHFKTTSQVHNLSRDAMSSGRYVPTFQNNLTCTPSQASTLLAQAAGSSETSVRQQFRPKTSLLLGK